MNKLKKLPIVSSVIVGINVIVFIYCMFVDNNLYRAGMLDAYRVLVCHEYGRVIWSLFLHADVSHILSNMMLLFFMGVMLEEELGHFRYLVLIFLSGTGGNLLSLLIKVTSGDMIPSIGASGIVFGLDGVLLAMVLFWNRRMPTVTLSRVVMMILLSLYSGFSGENVDNAAHIGGLLTGFLGGCVVCFLERRKRNRIRIYDN